MACRGGGGGGGGVSSVNMGYKDNHVQMKVYMYAIFTHFIPTTTKMPFSCSVDSIKKSKDRVNGKWKYNILKST